MNNISNNLNLSRKKNKNHKSIIKVGNVNFGKDFIIIAGPCSVESQESTLKTAQEVKKYGANILRGGAFKPRSSPYDFQGLGFEGIKILSQAGKEVNLPVISEILDPRDIEKVIDFIDIIQIGSRNMQNYSLLKEAGKIKKPILLKRGMSATINEWLNSAEYILSEGNPNVILCERGVRTFETYTRNTLDLSVVPAIHEISHLPIIVDPSHGTGRLSLIEPMSLAAVAAGTDGLMIEVHINPSQALCDAKQALKCDDFSSLANKVIKLRKYFDINNA